MYKKILISLLLAFIFGMVVGGPILSRMERFTSRVDTLVVYKSIVDSSAVIEAQRLKGYELVPSVSLDSLRRLADKPARVDYIETFVETPVPVVVVRDSLVYVQVPISETTFTGCKDSVDYRITASGYDVSLDRVEFHYPERTIIRTETIRQRQRLGLGATVGPGIVLTPSGKLYGGLGASVGLDIRF